MCGVIGVYDKSGSDVSRDIYIGLVYLQHRGQECSGIATFDGEKTRSHRRMGTVNEVYHPKIHGDVFGKLKGRAGIGHNRYSTTGESNENNIQPQVLNFNGKSLAIAHNGNLINTGQLKKECEDKDYVFESETDTEIIGALLILSDKDTIEESLFEALPRLYGAFSLVILCRDKLIGVRDKFGIRPLSWAKSGDKYIFVSESCAADRLNIDFIRSVKPAEMIIIDKNGLKEISWYNNEFGAGEVFGKGLPDFKICIFEYIYFASPDSILEGAEVHLVRRECGRILAKQAPVDADMVIAVPDSGISAAIGYSQQSGIPFDTGLFRSHQVGRTFMEPIAGHRESYQRLKHNALRETIREKRIIVVDDSIVRGNVSKKVVRFLNDFGAKEIHLRIASSPVKNVCYLGIDTPTREELIASNKTAAEIEKELKELGASSLVYLNNIQQVKDAVVKCCKPMFGSLLRRENFCTGCFNGVYPV